MESFESLIGRLERVTHKLESAAIERPNEMSNNDKFKNIVANELKDYLEYSTQIGDVVKCHAFAVSKCFTIQENLIKLTSMYSKPSTDEYQKVLAPLSEEIKNIVEFGSKNSSKEFADHLSAVSASVLALGWVDSPAPHKHIKSMQDSGDYYFNRILKAFKNKDEKHVAWVNSLKALWSALCVYTEKNHSCGLTWNRTGKPATLELLNSNSSKSATPPTSAKPLLNKNGDAEIKKSSLFDDINRGTSVTAGLKKVTDDMKTHKNAKLREEAGKQSIVKANESSTAVEAGSLDFLLNKWTVKNYNNDRNVKVVETEPKHSVNITRCKNSTISVSNKITQILIDNCQKVEVVFDDLIASIDIVNCRDIVIQTLGKLSTVNIDKTTGCQVYLSDESKSVDVITSQTSGVNILIKNANGEFDEYPVPEQFKTNFNGTRLVTVATDLF